MTKNAPATPLPWKSSAPMNMDRTACRTNQIRVDAEQSAVAGAMGIDTPHQWQDALYIAHSANAYPRPVERTKQRIRNCCSGYEVCDPDRALLRNLGEFE